MVDIKIQLFFILLVLTGCLPNGNPRIHWNKGLAPLKNSSTETSFYQESSSYFFNSTNNLKVDLLAKNQFSSQVPVLQNMTSNLQTRLTILRAKGLTHKYKILSADGHELPFEIQTKIANPLFEIDWISLKDLSTHQKYFLFILDKEDWIIDTRSFSTLDLENHKPRIAVASCARVGWLGGDLPPRSIYDQLAEAKPDFLIFLGDLVYPDTALQALLYQEPDDEQIRDKYVEAWQENKMYHLYNLFPVISVLDDHDYGFQGANALNNSDRQYPMLEYFRSFYPLLDDAPEINLNKGPAAAFSVELMGFRVILLDNKFYRTASGPDDRPGTIWGQKQLHWMRQMLDTHSLPTLIGSGTLITFPIPNQDAAQYESPDEFNNFRNAIKGAASNVILMSGDVHFSDVRKIPENIFGYSTYEVTSSRLHSISPIIIPPFISGYVGTESGQLMHTYEKNFTLLIPQLDSSFNGMNIQIHQKNSSQVLKSVVYP